MKGRQIREKKTTKDKQNKTKQKETKKERMNRC
jgi:hypothetical protein